MADSLQVVAFRLCEDRYAVNIQQVQEIIRYERPRSLAGTDPSITGLINLRGKIIPICDLKLRLGAEPGLDPGAARIVVVECPLGLVGVIVDAVEEVRTLLPESREALPEGTPRGGGLIGVAKVDDRLLVLLDPAELFVDAPVEVEDAAAVDELPRAA